MSANGGEAEPAPMEQSLTQMTLGYVPAQVLYAAAELGVADVLGDGPRTYESVAKETGTDSAALRRLLRALAGLGVVTQHDTERFSLTELGNRLRADVPVSERDDIVLSTAPELWRAWGELSTVVRSGAPARDPGTGLTAHEAMLRHPELSAKLRAGMAQAAREFASGVVGAYDFSQFHTVADFGGDEGTLIAAVLGAVPGLRGVLYDQPDALERAAAALGAAGVADRCEVVVGDLTKPVAAGADAFVLNNVVRDWGDEKATALLRNCRAGMTPTSRLLLVETLMPPVLTPDESAAYGLTDLNNLVFTGGRERTRDEYADLLDAAGFALSATVAVPVPTGMPDYHVIEGTPT
ncbi:methyltransferase [Streptomyces sp. NPDC002793]|uniref:methyltransferase n=1 Tax=Streptomyces sp. NPDC002793 TaxID=3154432 RepID=UPI0033283D77